VAIITAKSGSRDETISDLEKVGEKRKGR